jgi:hypothetical protein
LGGLSVTLLLSLVKIDQLAEKLKWDTNIERQYGDVISLIFSFNEGK